MPEAEYKKFYEKSIWQEAFTLQKEIFSLTMNLPRTEQYGLVDQLNRATNSVLANIAESDGRFHYADKARVLYIARGEIQEVQSHLMVAQSRGYLNKEECTGYINGYEEIKKQINGYIYSLVRSNKNKGEVN